MKHIPYPIDQDNDNNARLADVYSPSHTQLVVVFPLIWWHDDKGGPWICQGFLLEGEKLYVVSDGPSSQAA